MSLPVFMQCAIVGDADCEFEGDVLAHENPDGDLEYRCPECGARGSFHPVELSDPSLAWAAIDHADHRSVCPDGCIVCADYRAWGTCTRCGADDVEADDDGRSLCCTAPLLLAPVTFGEDWIREAALA